MPASTLSRLPVNVRPRSDSKKRIALLTSLGSIIGKSGNAVGIAAATCGVCSMTLNNAGFSRIIGVEQFVGATALPRIRSGASRLA